MPGFHHHTTGLDGPVQASMNNVWSLVQKQAGGDIHDPTAPTRLSQHRQVHHSLATQDFGSQADEARAITLHGNIHGQMNMPPPMDNAIDENWPPTEQENHHHDASFGIYPQALYLPSHLSPPTPMQPTFPVQPDYRLQQSPAQQLATAPLTPAQLQQLQYAMLACGAHLAQRGFAPQQLAGLLAVGVAPAPYSPFPQKQLAGTRKTGGAPGKQTAQRLGDAELAAKNATKKNAALRIPGLVARGQCKMGGDCVELQGTKCQWAKHFEAHPSCYVAADDKWVCQWSGCPKAGPYETAVYLAIHTMDHHLGVKYLCKCGTSCATSCTLKRHIQKPPKGKGVMKVEHGYAGQTNPPAVEAGPST